MLLAIAAVALLGLGTACSVSGLNTAAAEATASSQVAYKVALTVEAMPTMTPYPTYTPYPTVTPVLPKTFVATATPKPMPKIFLEIEGSGPTVTENFEWGDCEKAVFSWTATGEGKVDMRLHKIGNPNYNSRLADELSPAAGQGFQAIEAGTYFIEIKKGPFEGWTLVGECQSP